MFVFTTDFTDCTDFPAIFISWVISPDYCG